MRDVGELQSKRKQLKRKQLKRKQLKRKRKQLKREIMLCMLNIRVLLR